MMFINKLKTICLPFSCITLKNTLFILLGCFWGFHAWAIPTNEEIHVKKAEERLQKAIGNPEFMLKNWIDLPTSPASRNKRVHHLSLKEAILLALRYNPNIQNA